MRFLTISKIIKNMSFLKVLGLGTILEIFFVQFRIERTSRRSISRDFEFLKIHQKINFWLVRGVTGKARSQEMSIFEVFEHLIFFENVGKFVKVNEKL